MRKRLTFCVSMPLAVVLGVGPLLTLAGPAENRIKDSSRVAARDFAPNVKAAKSPNPLFYSKLLSRRRTQNETAVPGQTATLLPDGRVLKTGGLEDDGPVSAALIDESRSQLQFARAWHTATMLPDGKILIVGGMGADGQPVASAEIFDPENKTSEPLSPALGSSDFSPRSLITPRVYHTATLLTEGLVLISGGVSGKGDALKTAQLWDYRTRIATTTRSRLKMARYNHRATLLSNGKVLLSGGSDQDRANIEHDELYEPQSQRFSKVKTGTSVDAEFSVSNPRLAGSQPEDGAFNVQPDALIALRFSNPLQVRTVNTETVTLIGPYGRVEAKVVPAEGGMLAFVLTKSPLFPGALYTVSVSGSTDTANNSLAGSAISFSTAHALMPVSGFDDEEWIPDSRSRDRDWQSGRAASPWQSLPPLQAPPGVTALAGQVLKLNGKPLDNVTLKIDDKTTQTDGTGRFLLTDVAEGRHELLMDGRTASRGAKTYGVFEAGIVIKESETNILPYTIWMPKLDTAHEVTIPSPTTTEVVITTPHIPGLEVHLTPGTVIYDEDHKRVTRISITPIPVDRTPFPLPSGVEVPIYFTVQPGGAYVKTYGDGGVKGARIIYPNYTYQPPAARADFWHYDPEERGWYVYGQGSVTGDGTQTVPDPGVVIYQFTGAMVSFGGSAPTDGPPPGGGSSDGDPVDLYTGLFVLNNADLVLPDVISIVLSRTYRPRDTASRAFGIGCTHPYNMFLVGDSLFFTYAELILPDGGRLRFNRISPGNGYNDAVMEHTSSPTAFYKARLTWNGAGWDLTLKDGTVLVFGDNGTPVQSVRDRFGNQIRITRSSGQSGAITRITSPSGRWMEFSYDASSRITQARDLIGRSVNYTYDASGRLWKVTDPNGGVTEYTYDTSHRMLTVKDARGIVYLTNQYDANGKVIVQTQADSTTYQFAYTLDSNGKVTQTDITDPRGYVRTVTFTASGYVLTDTRGCCGGQSNTFERQAGTNLLSSVTDPLGRRTEYAYDSSGNTTGITFPAGTASAVTTSFSYEPSFNQLATVSDPLNHTTSFSYDSKGNLISMTDALSHQSTIAYNTAGQPISATDALGNTVQLGYDSGDFTTETNPLGQSVTGFTDAVGRKLSITDALGRTTRHEYDALSRPTRITDPMQGATLYAYDANSNLLSVTDPRGNVHSYTYNNMDRMATHTDPLLRVESYQYDFAGNLTQYTDRKGQVTTYTYDSLDRLTQVTYQDGSTTTYTYDTVGRLTQLVDSISGTTTYAYDDFDRLTSKTTPQGTITYAYDAASRRTSMTVPGQATINYAYDNADRLTQIIQGSSTVIIAYDDADRRTALTLPNGVTTQYGYDAISQLTSLVYTKGGVTLGNLTYQYDASGRVKKTGGSFARSDLPQVLASTSHDAANHQVGFGALTLTYDNNGNLTGDGVNAYTWNARDQLVGISGPGLAANFVYDGSGKRIGRTTNGVSTNYLYDGANIVQEQSGGSASANTLNGELDEVLMRTDSSGTLTPIGDGLGSVVALTDSAGTVQTQYTYEPFGKTTATGSTTSNASKYTGREDDGTGLYYYRARYYSPMLQRFISEDPIGFSGGLNFYTYVENDPVNGVDPYGLKTYVCCRPLRYHPLGFIRIPFARHCYILVTPGNSAPSKYGTSTAKGGLGTTYGLNGNFNGDLQLPKQDFRYDAVPNAATDCKPVKDSSPEKERKLNDVWDDRDFCKGCGENYNFAHGPNSNRYVSDILGAAGMTPPDLPRSWVVPGYQAQGLTRNLLKLFFGKR